MNASDARIERFVRAFNARADSPAVPYPRDPSLLEECCAGLPARLPPDLALLLTRYAWEQETDLGLFRLVENPAQPDFTALAAAMWRDSGLVRPLIAYGFIPFGKAPDMDYDPVCLDIRPPRGKGGDYPVVKIGHEEFLIRDKVVIKTTLAPSFSSLLDLVAQVS